MKIKYIEPKILIEKEEALYEKMIIKEKISLIDILNWENDWRREDIGYETDSMDIGIEFSEYDKTVYIWIDRALVTATFNTSNLSPEKIIEGIKLLLDWAGVEYED